MDMIRAKNGITFDVTRTLLTIRTLEEDLATSDAEDSLCVGCCLLDICNETTSPRCTEISGRYILYYTFAKV